MMIALGSILTRFRSLSLAALYMMMMMMMMTMMVSEEGGARREEREGKSEKGVKEVEAGRQ
jgi:hypothetical protein